MNYENFSIFNIFKKIYCLFRLLQIELFDLDWASKLTILNRFNILPLSMRLFKRDSIFCRIIQSFLDFVKFLGNQKNINKIRLSILLIFY